MNKEKATYTMRERVLELLTDDETSKVSKAETAAGLTDGDEYLDLEQLSQGVMKAHGESIAMGSALPKKSVQPQTWATILTMLTVPTASPSKTSHP